MTKEKQEIKLGDKVKDLITGYTGIVVARSKFINGCIQYSVAGKIKLGEKFPELGDPAIDEMNLKVIEKNVVNSCEYKKEKIEEPVTGGKTKYMKRMRGY